MTAANPPDWTDAACRGIPVARFYPESGEPFRHRDVCGNCPIQPKCLDWGLRHEGFGVWGGKSQRELASIRQEQGITIPGAEKRHGHNGWRRGCRCDVCIEGMRENSRIRNAERRNRPKATKVDTNG